MPAATSQITTLAASAGQGVAATTQINVMVAYNPPATLAVVTAQAAVLAATVAAEPIPRTSQVAMLVAYRTGAPEDFRLRAWTFTFDGHQFYVLHLGEQGTFVYDFSSGQWAKWQTAGHGRWNMEVGITWRGEVVAADIQNPIIWQLEPTQQVDEDFKPITRVVTGGLSVRQRYFPANYAFTLVGSVGEPSTEPAYVTLSYSDDQGRTYATAGTLTLEPGAYMQEMLWRSLGTLRAPGRVFRVEDTGALVRIDGADAEVEGEN